MFATDGKKFDTNIFFAGGAGMFFQYHDIIKPAYLYAVYKLIATENSFGLPISIIENMSSPSIIEWYAFRRYLNPFYCIDYLGNYLEEDLDQLLIQVLDQDPSIYTLAPKLNITRFFQIYLDQQFTFPIYIYSERYEPGIEFDCKELLKGIPYTYLHGDLKKALQKCDQNFTYIFSDIELMKHACEILHGSCSHILLAKEYRYNYRDFCKTPKYDLKKLMESYPFVRIGQIFAIDFQQLASSFYF